MKRRSAFELYVRTGRWVAEPVETKFNPWHDPDDGRFTFAGQGGYFGNGAPRSEGGTRRIATRSGSNAHVIAGSSMRSPATQAVTPPIRAQKPKPAPIPHLGARAKRSPSGKLRTSSASQTTRSVPAGTADQRSEAGSTGSLISTASNLKTAAANLKPGESRLVTVGDLKVVQFGPGVELIPIAVAPLEEFSAATAQGSAMFHLDAVITGPQFELFRGSYGLHGQAVVNGRILGKSAPEMYYMATVEGPNGVAHLTFGKGDPPPTGVATGFGGAVPLLINGQGVSGYNKAWKPHLESQKTGKNIVAYNSRANTVAVFIQPDGTVGHPLRDVRAYLRAAGYDYAVMFDGSGSTSLRYLGRAIVNPDLLREPMIPLGIGFRMKTR